MIESFPRGEEGTVEREHAPLLGELEREALDEVVLSALPEYKREPDESERASERALRTRAERIPSKARTLFQAVVLSSVFCGVMAVEAEPARADDGKSLEYKVIMPAPEEETQREMPSDEKIKKVIEKSTEAEPSCFQKAANAVIRAEREKPPAY